MHTSDFFDHFTQLYRPYIKITQPLLDEYKVHPAQWLIIKDIAKHPQTTLVQISKRRSIEKPTTRKILKAIDKRGWLKITQGEDKREKLLDLTNTGKYVHYNLKKNIEQLQYDILKTLDIPQDQLEQINRILERLYHQLHSLESDD
ncbi:MarR family winged helix-turn-helix transcriptional regulator [Staphylococcus felis]|uniref:MarR family winged helix-turn-helix transcriptional regulator n=1 Tax=Staphylococcus felis TaxID=46127 RepID=UPI000E22C854|nr:MarR family winged helix-turn-helix transcriptional regulator [Staphylococcus felis]REH79387.1 MarR family transcriptional regulator [Staphylococcus felis]REI12722.1 MarR family transcriptional regulator [Staphylococcus felis]REI26298.1 MarR family transcriptional regulator [Staphylococcus felis]